jgi:hypothetical protein
MAHASVNMDYDELKKLKEQIEKFGDQSQVDEFMKSCAKELAARLLAKVIKRTPAPTGELRRGWTGGKQTNARVYANSLSVNKVGNDYVLEIINPVEYASYVEYGHRTRNHRGWVEGKFMLTISEDEIRNSAPKILEKKLQNYLKGCFS